MVFKEVMMNIRAKEHEASLPKPTESELMMDEINISVGDILQRYDGIPVTEEAIASIALDIHNLRSYIQEKYDVRMIMNVEDIIKEE
jgi:hypothetical protein